MKQSESTLFYASSKKTIEEQNKAIPKNKYLTFSCTLHGSSSCDRLKLMSYASLKAKIDLNFNKIKRLTQ